MSFLLFTLYLTLLQLILLYCHPHFKALSRYEVAVSLLSPLCLLRYNIFRIPEQTQAIREMGIMNAWVLNIFFASSGLLPGLGPQPAQPSSLLSVIFTDRNKLGGGAGGNV